MGTSHRTIIRAAAIAAAAVFTLAGCGEADQEQDGKTSPTAPVKPATPRSQLVLTAADFPAGFQYHSLNPEQFSAGAAELAQPLRNAAYKPAECAQPARENVNAGQNLAKAASSAAATDPKVVGYTYSAVVSDTVLDLKAMNKNQAAPCADITASIALQGQAATSRHRYTTGRVPDAVKPAEALVFAEDVDISVGTSPAMSTHALRGYAIVRGYTVSLSVQSRTAVDRVAFETAFVKAVEKVRNAK